MPHEDRDSNVFATCEIFKQRAETVMEHAQEAWNCISGTDVDIEEFKKQRKLLKKDITMLKRDLEDGLYAQHPELQEQYNALLTAYNLYDKRLRRFMKNVKKAKKDCAKLSEFTTRIAKRGQDINSICDFLKGTGNT